MAIRRRCLGLNHPLSTPAGAFECWILETHTRTCTGVFRTSPVAWSRLTIAMLWIRTARTESSGRRSIGMYSGTTRIDRASSVRWTNAVALSLAVPLYAIPVITSVTQWAMARSDRSPPILLIGCMAYLRHLWAVSRRAGAEVRRLSQGFSPSV